MLKTLRFCIELLTCYVCMKMEMQAERKERSSMVLNESSTMAALLRLTRPLP